MGLESIIREIQERTTIEVNRIISEAEKKAKKLILEAENEVNAEKRKKIEDAEKELERIKKMEKSIAELEMKKNRLTRETEIIEILKKKFFDAILTEYQVKMDKVLKRILQEIENESFERAYVAKGDRGLAIELRKAGLEVIESEEISGGAILESSDGSIRVNKTLDLLLEDFFQRNLPEIRYRLFGNRRSR